jgi:2-polyprenyl-3-methyl-5-hydroxy-6-metoxy-1,4-benzoquinol methylase
VTIQNNAPPSSSRDLQGLSAEEAAALRSSIAELERATADALRGEAQPASGRFTSNLDLLRRVWDIEVDFNREEGNPRSEPWYRHFEEINRRWNIRYEPPQVSGPDAGERHVQLLAELEALEQPAALSLDYRPTSHRPFVGRLIVGFKRLFFHLLQPYLAGLLELLRSEQRRAMQFQSVAAELHRVTLRTLLLQRQSEFNAEVVRLLNEITKYVLFTRQKRFNREATHVLEALPEQVQEVYDLLDRRLAILEQRHDGQAGPIAELERRGRHLLRELESALSGLKTHASGSGSEPAQQALGKLKDHRYQEFEDVFRGSRGEIMRRQRRYLGYFLGCRRVVDLGCGRGEFLELCRDNGVAALGVDINSDMVRTCHEMGLEAHEADLLQFLAAQPDGSLDGVFSAQVIEHLDKETLFELLRLCCLKLRPGSYLILETLNVDNLIVGASRFYADITHVRPIPSSTLEFLARSFGFDETFVLYSSPVPEEAQLRPVPVESSAPGEQRWAVEIINSNFERLNQVLYTYQDYALVARRPEEAAASMPAAPGEEQP